MKVGCDFIKVGVSEDEEVQIPMLSDSAGPFWFTGSREKLKHLPPLQLGGVAYSFPAVRL